jgi:arsenical pump membrane protein
MWFAYIVSVVISISILWIVLRKDIPAFVDISLLKNPDEALKSKTLFKFSWLFLVVLLIGYFVGDHYNLAVSVFALGGALILLLIATLSKHVNAILIIKNAPWQVVWFSIGLYVVVYGLKNAGLTDQITIVINYLSQQGHAIAVIGTGLISALLSAIMNNMPTIMIMDIALHNNPNQALIYANIVGANLGPKMTPFGSLATLLWLHVLAQKGINIGFWQYTKFGLLITPPVLLVVLFALI